MALDQSRNDALRQMLAAGQTVVLPFELESTRRQFAALLSAQKANGELLAQSMQESSETWHDNAAAEAISADSLGLSSQAASLAKALNEGRVLEYPDPTDQSVTIGSLVTVDFGDNDLEDLLLTGITTDIREINKDWSERFESITVNSPLGSALIGAQPGEEVSYSVNGRKLTIVVQAVKSFAEEAFAS